MEAQDRRGERHRAAEGSAPVRIAVAQPHGTAAATAEESGERGRRVRVCQAARRMPGERPPPRRQQALSAAADARLAVATVHYALEYIDYQEWCAVGGPSPWAWARFGGQAEQVWRRVPQALAAAVSRALNAHQASRLSTNHAFGNSRWPLQYEELVNHLQDLPDAVPIRPPHAFYKLVIVHGQLLLPWYYADHPVSIEDARAVRPVGRLAVDLLTRFGPPRQWHQPPLPLTMIDDDDEEDRRRVAQVTSALDEMDPPPQIVLVGYACNSHAGLIDIQWGEAALGDDRALQWYHHEPLPIPAPLIPRPRPGDGGVS